MGYIFFEIEIDGKQYSINPSNITYVVNEGGNGVIQFTNGKFLETGIEYNEVIIQIQSLS